MTQTMVRAKSYVDERGRRVVEFDPADLELLHPYDRPPLVIVEQMVKARGEHYDTSPGRPQIRQRFPGRPIEELRGRHAGAAGARGVAILHNGPTLNHHDLSRLSLPTIGMNRTHLGFPGYFGPQPTYLCYSDHCWANSHTVQAHPQRIDGSTLEARTDAWRATKSPRMWPFSCDLGRDGYVSAVPCATGFLALQVAVFMGFRKLYCLGLDLQGGHLDGTRASSAMDQAVEHYRKMAPRLAELGVEVYIVGSPDSLLAGLFPTMTYDHLLELQGRTQ